jgi:hypothetical protein
VKWFSLNAIKNNALEAALILPSRTSVLMLLLNHQYLNQILRIPGFGYTQTGHCEENQSGDNDFNKAIHVSFSSNF